MVCISPKYQFILLAFRNVVKSHQEKPTSSLILVVLQSHCFIPKILIAFCSCRKNLCSNVRYESQKQVRLIRIPRDQELIQVERTRGESSRSHRDYNFGEMNIQNMKATPFSSIFYVTTNTYFMSFIVTADH